MKKFVISGFEPDREMSLDEIEVIAKETARIHAMQIEYCDRMAADPNILKSDDPCVMPTFNLSDGHRYANMVHTRTEWFYQLGEVVNDKGITMSCKEWSKTARATIGSSMWGAPVDVADVVARLANAFKSSKETIERFDKKINNFMKDIRAGKQVCRGWLLHYTKFDIHGIPTACRMLYVNQQQTCDVCGYLGLPKTVKNHRNGIKCKLDAARTKARNDDLRVIYMPDVINAVSRGELPGTLVPVEVMCWVPEWVSEATSLFCKSLEDRKSKKGFAGMDVVEYLKSVNPNT